MVGFNIVNLIDKKISNISVNIPKIEIPKQNIVLNISEEGGRIKVDEAKYDN
jgi:hypothetical protein